MNRDELAEAPGMKEDAPKAGPSVLRVKAEKREQAIEPAGSQMNRRRFLTFLGTGSAALAAGSAGVFGVPSEAALAQDEETTESSSPSSGGGPFFTAIEPSDRDDLIVPEGFKYDLILSSEDSMARR
ncbi:MAG: twin-arginine translocation signal domain-containing protein [Rubrobacter sp.]